MDLSKYKSLFVTESREHLDAMTQNLLDFEKDPTNMECIEELFRHAHSIKGMAASMGYGPIETLSHRIEDLMDEIRKDRLETTSDTIDVLLAGRDILEKLVIEVDEKDEPAFQGADKVIKRVETYREKHAGKTPKAKPKPKSKPKAKPKAPPAEEIPGQDLGDFDGEVVSVTGPDEAGQASSLSGMVPDWPEDHIQKAESGVEKKWLIRVRFKEDTPAPAARAFLALKKLEDLGKLTSEPSAEMLRKGEFGGNLNIKLLSDVEMTEISKILDDLSEVKEYHIEPEEVKAPAPAAPESVAVPASYELPHSIRVDTRALDRFVNMVGELLTVKSGLRTIAQTVENPDLNARLDRLESLIHDLHSQVMEVRMMPLDSITGRFPRTVRDLARQANKKVDFRLSGQDIELDRAILGKLVDLLIHILRNSVDHGIEKPKDREKLRKPSEGKLTLTAYREKDYVAIEVADDGKGIDIEALKESAIGKGIITAEDAKSMGAHDSLMLICTPGFSTSEEVSFISGRGVGMDVVRSTIENLGGILNINTQLGQGTRITLMLPRSVAILNVLLVSLGPQIFAVPIGKLIRTIELGKSDFQTSQRGKMIFFRGEAIPVYDLRSLLKMPVSTNDRQLHPALVVESGQKQFALMVDGFLGQEEAFIRPLGRPLSRIDGLAGVMTRGDGRPVFVLDVANLV